VKKLLALFAVLGAVACGPERKDVSEAEAKARDAAKAAGQMSYMDTEQNVQALTCIQMCPPPFQSSCCFYKPDPPAGAFDCTSDKTAYSGEFLNFYDVNGGSYCMGRNMATSGQGLSSVGDYNDHIYSVKNNTGGNVQEYADINYGGAATTVFTGGQTIQNTSSGWMNAISSVRKQ